MKTLPLLAVLVSTVALSACASASNSAGASNARDPDAASIVGTMAQRDSHLSAGPKITAATDGFHLLGRPGQYTSMSLLTDDQSLGSGTFVSAQAKADGNYADGYVEVFDNAADTRTRAQYVAAVGQSGQPGVEYGYVSGTALLEIYKVTAAQAGTVAADFSAVTGEPAGDG